MPRSRNVVKKQTDEKQLPALVCDFRAGCGVVAKHAVSFRFHQLLFDIPENEQLITYVSTSSYHGFASRK
jgi:hypothetical protein